MPTGPSDARDSSLDVMKAIGILAVVVGHSLMYSRPVANAPLVTYSLTTIYLFNVQSFAFVSGYLATKSPLRRVRTILEPLASWIVLYALSALSLRGFLPAIQNFTVGALQGGSNLWFLWALFLGLVLLGILYRRFPRLTMALAAVWGIGWQFIPAASGIRLVGYILPFLVLGRSIRTYEDEHGRIDSFRLLAGLLVFAYLCHLLILHPQLGLPDGGPLTAIKAVLTMLASATACLGLLGLSRVLSGRTAAVLASIGTMSIGIYGFNSLITLRFLRFFQTTGIEQIPLRLAVLLAASVALTWLVGRSRILSALLLGGRIPSASAHAPLAEGPSASATANAPLESAD